MTFENAWTCTVVLLLVAGILGCGDEQGPIADETTIVTDRPGLDGSQPNTSNDAAEIQKLIPEASAMARQDMERLATYPTPPKEADVEEKSLTLMLLTLNPASSQQPASSHGDEPVSKPIEKTSTEQALPEPAGPTEEASSAESQLPEPANDNRKEQFQFLTPRIPKPSRIAQEIYRGTRQPDGTIVPQGPVTFLHADRITDCSCEADGDTAKGTVSFEVSQLYQGKVDYVAKRRGGSWQIQEFIMSAYDIHLVRNAEGKWEKK